MGLRVGWPWRRLSDRWLRMRVGHVRISATGARRSPATDVRCSSHLILLAEGCVSRTRPLDPPRSNFAAAPAHQIRRAPPTNSAPLVGARRVSDEGPALAELGNRGRKTGVKDEAPPLARRRVGSGLSGFGALSFLACGGGVSFHFSAPAVHVGGPVLLGVFSFLAPAVSVCGSGSFRCRFVCGARALRLRCGAERVVALRGACRCAGWAHRFGVGERSPQVGIIAKPGLGRSHSGSLRVQG